MGNNNMGLVLGGVASGALNTIKQNQEQARLNQAAADLHAEQTRSLQIQNAGDQIANDAAAAGNTGQTLAPASVTAPPAGALPTPAVTGTATVDTNGNSVPAPPPPPAATHAAAPVTAPGLPFNDSMVTPVPISSAPTPTGPTVPPDPAAPRGVRNNNWGNVTPLPDGQQWAGQVGTDGDFVKFDTPQSGIAATLKNIEAKSTLHGLNTVNGIYADPKVGWDPGNTTGAANIAKTMGVGPNDKINVADPATADSLAHAIFTQEQGGAAYHKALSQLHGPQPAVATTSASGQPVTPSTPLYTSQGSIPSIFDAPDGSGPMTTYSPRRDTGTTAADQTAYKVAAYLRSRGEGAQAMQIEQGIQDRQMADQKLNAGDIDARRGSLTEAVANAQDVDDVERIYNSMGSNNMHARATQNTDGSVHVDFLSNDTNKKIGHDDFASLPALKTQVGNMIKDPAGYQAVQDAHDTIVHNNNKTDADASYLGALGARSQADVTAGLPGAQAAAAKAGADDAEAHAAEQQRQTGIATQVQTLSSRLATETDQNTRDELNRQLAALRGQQAPQTQNIMDNGVATTETIYNGNGARSVPDQRTGEIEAGVNKAAVYSALDAANKAKVPLAYGKHVDPLGTVSFGFSIPGYDGSVPGKPNLGMSPSPDAILTAYKQMGQGAIPAAGAPKPAPRTLAGDAINVAHGAKNLGDNINATTDAWEKASGQYVFGLPGK